VALQIKAFDIAVNVLFQAHTLTPQDVVREEAGTRRVVGFQILGVPLAVVGTLRLVLSYCVVVHPCCTEVCRLLASVNIEDGRELLIWLHGLGDREQSHYIEVRFLV